LSEDDLTSPDEAITLSDIRRADSRIVISEPDTAHIYPEPFVRYNWNPATQTHESVISVTGTTAEDADFDGLPDYSSDFVSAPSGVLSGNEAEELWDACVNLRKMCGTIKKPPTELTDLKWANGNEANANEIAKQRIFSWVYWMRLKRVSFKVDLLCTAGGGAATAVRNWQEGQRFKLTLPHETNNSTIECLAHRIAIDPNPPYHIEVSAYMLETEKLEEAYYIQDTWDETYTEWQDVYDTVAEAPGVTDEDIQDEY
jgi:hypothetical protein